MEKNNINYIKYDKNKLIINLNNSNDNITLNTSLFKYIKDLFIQNLNTYISYKENINTHLKFKRLFPLYINSKIQFIYFKSLNDEQIIINFSNIKNILKSKTTNNFIIKFNDDTQIKILNNCNIFIKKIKQLKEIILFLKSQQNILDLK